MMMGFSIRTSEGAFVDRRGGKLESHIWDSSYAVEVWGGLRLHLRATRSAGDGTRALRCWWRGSAGTPRRSPHPAPHRPHPRPAPASAPAEDPRHQHGLLHRERLLQAGRRHSRHPAGRSWRQCGRCQNPGEFPGPHGAEEDKERRARPEGPGSGGTRRSWGRPGRLGRRPQRRLGQFPRRDGCSVPFAVTRLPCRVCDHLLPTNLPAPGALPASPRDSFSQAGSVEELLSPCPFS